MKRVTKIVLWVVGGFLLLVFGAMLSADIWVSRLVQKEVHKAFEKIPDADAAVGHIYLNIISGSAIVTDITFVTHSMALEDTISGKRQPGLAMHVPTLSVWNINYMELLRHHHLSVYKVTIDDPILLVYLDEKNPEALLPTFPKDTTLEKASRWLERSDIKHIELNNLEAKLHSTRSPIFVGVDSLSFSCHHIGYDFTDSLLTYNDSVYKLQIGSLMTKLPDGISELEVHQFYTKNQGEIKTGYMRFRNTITPKQMADKAKEPISWVDMELNSLTTSPLNPIRKALNQDLSLDKLQVDVKRAHIYRDARYAPRHPFPTPQEVFRKLPVRFDIEHIEATVRKMDLEFSSTNVNCGQMHLKNIHATVNHMTNRPGAVCAFQAHAPFGEAGIVDAQLKLHMDKVSTFDMVINAKDVETHDINSFLRPLVGMTCDCHVDQLNAEYSGDHLVAKGEFCMQYHGLTVQVYKEDNIPYKIVTKNAEAITSFANTLIPKSNPTAVDIAPRRYMVEWKREEIRPYPFYLFGPCIDGVIKTMLPGLFVHKQTKNKK